MDDIKQEKLEKTCKKEKDHKVRIRKSRRPHSARA